VARRKPVFLVMSPPAPVPPVVDAAKRATIDEIKTKSFFSLFNIVAVVAILVIGYFLYRKFTEKFQSGAIRLPSMEPTAPSTTVQAGAAPIVEEESEEDEVPDSKED